MFGLVVKFYLKEDLQNQFDELCSKTLEEIKSNESGTTFYGCHKVEGEPTARIFYELYASRAAFDAHEQTAHVLHFLKERKLFLSNQPRVEFFSSFEGKGEVFR